MKALIHQFLAKPMSGANIEARSFEVIDSEACRNGFSDGQWEVVRRMIHTVGDVQLAAQVRFSAGVIDSGVAALKQGAPLYVDSNMIRAGLSIARLQRVCQSYSVQRIHCHVSDADVISEANAARLPRSLFAVRKAKPLLEGAIAVFGNAPIALLELNRMILEEGVRPALVIGLPVGFVHVSESKEELERLRVPSILVPGRRGGSPLAVSVVHALCSCAEKHATVCKEGA